MAVAPAAHARNWTKAVYWRLIHRTDATLRLSDGTNASETSALAVSASGSSAVARTKTGTGWSRSGIWASFGSDGTKRSVGACADSGGCWPACLGAVPTVSGCSGSAASAVENGGTCTRLRQVGQVPRRPIASSGALSRRPQ